VLAGISHLVSEISKEMAVAVAPSGGGQVIERVSLVAIDGGRVLAVVSTDVGPTRTAVLMTDGTLHERELTRATDLLNAWLRGGTLSDAADTIETRIEELETKPGEWLAGLLDGVRAFLSPGTGERIHFEGARYIFRHPEFSSDASSLGEILDSEETLADVVRGPATAAEVRVVIGGENPRRGMSQMSLVAGTYRIGGSVARMGIIGPTRMRYPRLIGLVGYFSKALDDLLAE
jgi:heat-inducible transcriptional repressor